MLKIVFRRFFQMIRLMKSRILVFFYKLRFQRINFGENILFNGRPIFRIGELSNVTLGSNLVFSNHSKYNMVGLGKRCSIYVAKQAKLIIGDNCGLSGVSIYCSTNINIGKYVNIGGNVSIWDTDFHPLEFQARRIHKHSEILEAPITIGNDVFIGANSIILKGVNIGEKSIVGAGSVVTKNIPANQIWAGNPAKFIRNIN